MNGFFDDLRVIWKTSRKRDFNVAVEDHLFHRQRVTRSQRRMDVRMEFHKRLQHRGKKKCGGAGSAAHDEILCRCVVGSMNKRSFPCLHLFYYGASRNLEQAPLFRNSDSLFIPDVELESAFPL